LTPDWIVLPAGNLGNTAAFGKALYEAKQLGLIEKLPRLAAIQAEGANPFYQSFQNGFSERIEVRPETVASAIRIGRPVSYKRAVRALEWTNGLVEQVSDDEIMDAKAIVDRTGIGCEPASAASVAGTRKLARQGVIQPHETVVSILTGNLLKDPDTTVAYHTGANQYANTPVKVEASFEAVRAAIEAVL
jgi:threonine synthase